MLLQLRVIPARAGCVNAGHFSEVTLRVQLLNTVPDLRARPGSIVEVSEARAKELIAGKEAIIPGQAVPVTDPDTRFARSLEGDSPRPVDRGAI